jgi:hypothetical protein
MSAGAHRGDHDIAFYEAAIEDTFTLTATTSGLTEAPSDADGPLPPGRYLIQVRGISSTQVVWIHVGKFVKGAPLAPSNPIGPGTRRFPLTSAIVAIETHCLKGYSDRISAQVSTGASVPVYISRVSTTAHAGF